MSAKEAIAEIEATGMPINKSEWFKMATTYSERITKLETLLIDQHALVVEAREAVNAEELIVTIQVQAEQENGKPRFSNETARKAEVSARLKESETHSYNRGIVEASERLSRMTQIDRDEAARLFSIAKVGMTPNQGY